MAISALDLFKIGVGPSSSHTMGPMLAGYTFVQQLGERIDDVASVHVDLFGSLAATGVGHGTDRAVVGGLLGHRPDACDPDDLQADVARVNSTNTITVGGRELPFEWASNISWHRDFREHHPNALDITAFDGDGDVVFANTYYSIGGGFIVDEEQAEAGETGVVDVDVEFPFNNGAELLEMCEREGLTVAELVARNELAWRPEAETRAGLLKIWETMKACVQRGCEQEGFLPGGLRVPRRAPELHRRLNARNGVPNLITQTFSAMDWVNLYALAVNEENAGGGKVVTAPTNGAA
ncbi:MAG TPA: L-serine ammonia-lyase, iron-sulfur-dependent, subunit alpha, partial [Tessaracoccus flavescens]|nr:L-serine ammonia-lyase, iron-sulfur-dependent, subunit alpha [Tessaracoccus flavescens]